MVVREVMNGTVKAFNFAPHEKVAHFLENSVAALGQFGTKKWKWIRRKN
jgi:hypothetical protein